MVWRRWVGGDVEEEARSRRWKKEMTGGARLSVKRRGRKGRGGAGRFWTERRKEKGGRKGREDWAEQVGLRGKK